MATEIIILVSLATSIVLLVRNIVLNSENEELREERDAYKTIAECLEKK